MLRTKCMAREKKALYPLNLTMMIWMMRLMTILYL